MYYFIKMNNTNETDGENDDSKKNEITSSMMPVRQSQIRYLIDAVVEQPDQEKKEFDALSNESSANISSKHEWPPSSEASKTNIIRPTPQKQSIMEVIQHQSVKKDNIFKTVLNSDGNIPKPLFNTPMQISRPKTASSVQCNRNADRGFKSVLTPSFSKTNIQFQTPCNTQSSLQSRRQQSILEYSKNTPLYVKQTVKKMDESGIDKLEETHSYNSSLRQLLGEAKENDFNIPTILIEKPTLCSSMESEANDNYLNKISRHFGETNITENRYTIPLASVKEESTKQPTSEPKILFQCKPLEKPFFQRSEVKSTVSKKEILKSPKMKKLHRDDIEKHQTSSTEVHANIIHLNSKNFSKLKHTKKTIEHSNVAIATNAELTKSIADKNEKSLTVGNASYIIESKLGEGGSSVVYLTTCKRTREQRAVKVVNLSGEYAVVEGYLNEVKLLCRLQGSDKVIRMFQYVHLSAEKQLLVVMERGETDLQCLIKKFQQNGESTLPISTLAHYWIQMLEAVKYIHDNGVIHSDLKPANFLYVNGRLKLIDFGIASSITDDQTSVIKHLKTGTFNYMSPEALQESSGPNSPHIKGQPNIKITYKSDVWSLGCILYLLLYSRTPFGHLKRPYVKMAAITDPEPKVNYPELPFYPSIFIKIVQKCLVHNPKARPPVEQLLEIPRWPFSNCPHQTDK